MHYVRIRFKQLEGILEWAKPKTKMVSEMNPFCLKPSMHYFNAGRVLTFISVEIADTPHLTDKALHNYFMPDGLRLFDILIIEIEETG